ncbi:Cation transport ATPase [Laribacter hongkongensis HLHK9]|uniref:Cation transport ATPase n=1 Tax=Laribacter hongkongensis (strain HLHK9) TaxID=557598 RepID=C1DC61_LARHH|nr:HAD-IC family P-type ATPase [Laribacter hongkongensis]ACO73478.1 Cation transport ATPase [Laribacter hongkongensis HLHK9]
MSNPPSSQPVWHALDPEATLNALDSRDEGLDAAEAGRRQQRHGPNLLPQAAGRPAWQRFLLQFHNLLIYVLLGSLLVTLLLQDWVDSAVIAGVVVINAVIGFLQEGRAEQALAAIRDMLALHATVIRSGQRQEIDAAGLVPGDIVLLQAGDKVPADLRLLAVRALRIDEATLTGESVPVDKQAAACAADVPLAERACLAYSGTLVTYGQARGVVVATGSATEIGHINTLLNTVETGSTPLTRQLDQFARWLTLAIGLTALLTMLAGVLWRGYGWGEVLMIGVGLAVAAIPEGLPAIVTITLAIGVERMARQRAIMRRLPAVETLGAVTVICTDKTGTLTRNEMAAGRILTADCDISVTGQGYAPDGQLLHAGQPVCHGDNAALDRFLTAIALCNDATLRQNEAGWEMLGDPTEGALLTLAHKAGLPWADVMQTLPRLDAIPFESEHRFMATLHRDASGRRLILVKGAPEVILERAGTEWSGAGSRPFDRAAWQARAEALADEGFRVLAIAMRYQSGDHDQLDFADTRDGLVLLGLVGLIDPPRQEAADAVSECHSAGIRVKMITGDHAATARAIGLRLGIGDGRQALTGQEIDRLDDAALQRTVREVDVFARMSPEHKLRLVGALQHTGAVVAMTGDGVNDAPALKRADVGVAMGGKGTEAAKEAAEMVVTDDNFASIARAVREGRTVYDNLKKAILFILPTNVGEAAIIIAAILAGVPLPITPVQILWINMVTAVTLALTLAFEPPEDGVMQRPPRAPGAGLIDAVFVRRLLLVGLLMVVFPFLLYLWALWRGLPVAHASTLAVNCMVAVEIAYLFNTRTGIRSALGLTALRATRPTWVAIGVLLLLQLAFTYWQPLQRLFTTQALDGGDWLMVGLSAVLTFLIVEADKAWCRRRG